MSDIDTVVVNSLKALDPEWPIREADIAVPTVGSLNVFPKGERGQSSPILIAMALVIGAFAMGTRGGPRVRTRRELADDL